MDIKTRAQAAADGDKTYFTGKVCKNGHMTYRYVQSGGCYDCINSSRIKPDSLRKKALSAEHVELAMRRAAIRETLSLVKFRCFPNDLETVKLIIFSSVFARNAEVLPDDIDPKMPGIDFGGGTYVYRFYCHPDDIDELRLAVNDVVASMHPVDIAKARHRAEFDKFKDGKVPEYLIAAIVR